jgi:cell division transport system permease protein
MKPVFGALTTLLRGHPHPVHAALRLHKHPALRLSGLLVALCGWLMAIGGGSAMLLQQLYTRWDLTQAQTLTIYLPTESDPTLAPQLLASLPTLQGVQAVTLVEPAVVQSWVQAWLPAGGPSATQLPLPTVLSVQVAPGTPREALLTSIHTATPTAEVADHQAVRTEVASAVRLLQGALLGLVGLMAVLLSGIMALSLRAALQAQTNTLQLLLLLGSPDALLQRVVRRVVLRRTVAGWLTASGLAGVLLAAVALAYLPLRPLMGWPVAAVVALAPASLPLLAWLVCSISVRRTLLTLVP